METAKKEEGDDKEKLKTLAEKIKIHKYVGDTSRSVFERSWEHVHDFENLSVKSHILKHAVDLHQTDDFSKLEFGIKVIKVHSRDKSVSL